MLQPLLQSLCPLLTVGPLRAKPLGFASSPALAANGEPSASLRRLTTSMLFDALLPSLPSFEITARSMTTSHGSTSVLQLTVWLFPFDYLAKWILIGYSAHKSAPFLPWHRYYIHLYERALKEDCSFTGDLPYVKCFFKLYVLIQSTDGDRYWDWSLDWNKFHSAPVWDSSSGLGGDGDASGFPTVGEGRCVTDGPFSGIEVRYFDDKEHPHCLSRGFPDNEELKELGELIKPDVIDDLMTESDYDAFASEIERRGHKFLSHSVRGDLSKFTGPNGKSSPVHSV